MTITTAIPETFPVETYDFEMDHGPLATNARLARKNRAVLNRYGTTAIEFIGAPGSGKTTLIARLVQKLKPMMELAVFNGDAARRSNMYQPAALGVPVVPIATHNHLHLDASSVGKALGMVDLDRTMLILVENPVSPVGPTDLPLGCKARVIVLSVTDSFVAKEHSHIFLGASLVVINKIDLAPDLCASLQPLLRDIQNINPDIQVIPASCTMGVAVNDVAAAILAL